MNDDFRRPIHYSEQSPDAMLEHRYLRVLLVEDIIINQRVGVMMLKKLGHSAVVAADGRKAIDALDVADFDVVLMDLQMPVMDGFTAMRIIRQREMGTGQHMPILAVTADAMAGVREHCLDAGFDGYVVKPLHLSDLEHALANLDGIDSGCLEMLETVGSR